MHIILEILTAVACRKKRHLGNIKLRWEHSLRKLNVPTESKNKQTGDPSLAEHSYILWHYSTATDRVRGFYYLVSSRHIKYH